MPDTPTLRPEPLHAGDVIVTRKKRTGNDNVPLIQDIGKFLHELTMSIAATYKEIDPNLHLQESSWSVTVRAMVRDERIFGDDEEREATINIQGKVALT